MSSMSSSKRVSRAAKYFLTIVAGAAIVILFLLATLSIANGFAQEDARATVWTAPK